MATAQYSVMLLMKIIQMSAKSSLLTQTYLSLVSIEMFEKGFLAYFYSVPIPADPDSKYFTDNLRLLTFSLVAKSPLEW